MRWSGGVRECAGCSYNVHVPSNKYVKGGVSNVAPVPQRGKRQKQAIKSLASPLQTDCKKSSSWQQQLAQCILADQADFMGGCAMHSLPVLLKKSKGGLKVYKVCLGYDQKLSMHKGGHMVVGQKESRYLEKNADTCFMLM